MKDDPDRTEQFKRENRMAQMAKLRIPWETMGEMANIERALAAGTIQDLMDEVEAWQKAMQKAERDIAELREERDEARVEVCIFWDAIVTRRVTMPFPPTKECFSLAQSRGWDCFKEKP